MRSLFLYCAFLLFVACSTSLSSFKNYSIKDLPPRNLVFSAPEETLDYDELWFVVEVPRGEIHKYELRTASGSLIMDRILCPRKVENSDTWISGFPASYGISPGRLNVDGDPLDLLLLGQEEDYMSQIKNRKQKARKVRVIGALKMEECEKAPCRSDKEWVQDWKIIAVDMDDPRFVKTKDVAELSSSVRSNLMTYFSHYKGNTLIEGKSYPLTRAQDFLNKKDALAFIAQNFVLDSAGVRQKEIEECTTLYEQTYTHKKYKKELDATYLNCLQRVHSSFHFPSHSLFKNFLNYSAYQLLLSLGSDPNKTRVEDAVEQMDNRRKARLEYFRFVTLDTPQGPGTGDVIFEWVRTKNRNKGCPVEFPPQPYDGQSVLPHGI